MSSSKIVFLLFLFLPSHTNTSGSTKEQATERTNYPKQSFTNNQVAGVVIVLFAGFFWVLSKQGHTTGSQAFTLIGNNRQEENVNIDSSTKTNSDNLSLDGLKDMMPSVQKIKEGSRKHKDEKLKDPDN